MSTKFINFLAMTWFISIVTCMIIEGVYFSSLDTSVFNDLRLFTSLKVGGLVPIPAFNIYFFRGIYRLLIWDYSFYSGGYIILRYFWMVTLSTGAVWGIGQTFAPVFANLLRIFR